MTTPVTVDRVLQPQFTPQEIAMAARLRGLGLPWEPVVGHYVLDEQGTIQPGSPFQDRVYFILNMKQHCGILLLLCIMSIQ